MFMFVGSRDTIRKRLQRERREKQEAELRKAEARRLELEIGELERRAAEQTDPQHEARLLPDLPLQLDSFAHGKILRAVRLADSDVGRNEVARGAKLTPQNATRVRRMTAAGLFSLNERGKLVVDARVAQVGGRIALRYLSERGERWLDPYFVSPLPRLGG